MAHCRFLSREDTVAVANGFVQPIDVNIDTVTASLVLRRRMPIRAKIEVPSPVTAPPAAPVAATHRRWLSAGLHLRFAHGPPNSGDGPAKMSTAVRAQTGKLLEGTICERMSAELVITSTMLNHL